MKDVEMHVEANDENIIAPYSIEYFEKQLRDAKVLKIKNDLIPLGDTIPTEHGKLFFGDYDKFVRNDYLSFESIEKLSQASESNSWFKQEVDYKNDKVGCDRLPLNALSKFKKTIVYQNLMDSAVVNLFAALSATTTNVELQYLYNRINIEENIHAMTYGHGLNIVFGQEAKEILDMAYNTPEIKRRLDFEKYYADKFIEIVINQKRDDDEAKMAILQALGATFLLEGIKFPSSFYLTWNINKVYENPIQGFSRSLKLISWDEMTVHTTTGSTVMKILKKYKDQGFQHLFPQFETWFRHYAEEVVNEDMIWNEYLLEDGEIPGFTYDIGQHVSRYWADKRCSEMGFNVIYGEKKSDIIDWMNSYRDLKKGVTALQEADATNYQKGKLKNDLDRFDDFKFKSLRK